MQTKADLLTQTKADLLSNYVGSPLDKESQPHRAEAGKRPSGVVLCTATLPMPCSDCAWRLRILATTTTDAGACCLQPQAAMACLGCESAARSAQFQGSRTAHSVRWRQRRCSSMPEQQAPRYLRHQRGPEWAWRCAPYSSGCCQKLNAFGRTTSMRARSCSAGACIQWVSIAFLWTAPSLYRGITDAMGCSSTVRAPGHLRVKPPGSCMQELFQQIAEDLAAEVPTASELAAYSCSPPQQDAPAGHVQRSQQQRTVLLTQLQQQQAAGRRRQEQLWACC